MSQKSDSTMGAGERYFRRVQKTGGSTYIVSLPSQWARVVGLKPKQELVIIPQSDLSLLIVPGPKDGFSSEGLVDATRCADVSEALREFIANYIAGFDSIRIKCGIGEFRQRLKAQIREKLIGVEIIEETTDHLVTQCLHGDVELPLAKALRRMALLVASMLRDSVQSLLEGDLKLAEEVVDRDDEVDRFAHYIFRQLNRSLLNPTLILNTGMRSVREFIPFTILVRSVERIADHATQIASATKELGGLRLEQSLVAQMSSLAKNSISMFEGAMDAVYRLDHEKANEVIRTLEKTLEEEAAIVGQLFDSNLNAKQASLLRLALESMRRVAEYSADICEAVVDVSVYSAARPSEFRGRG